MKLLIVSNMYPDFDSNKSFQGVFVQEQLESLSKIFKKPIDLYILRGSNFISKYIFTIFRIYYLILKNKTDIVHIHYGLSGLFICLKCILINPPKFILTCHGSDLQNNSKKGIIVKYITLYVASKCDAVICISKTIKKVLNNTKAKKYILPCGVNLDFFIPSYYNSHYFVFPGSKSNSIKNFSLFEKILNAYNQRFGSFSYRCMEGLNRQETLSLIQNSSALVMTSHSEGSPQSIKEALACDIPVISSKVGDVPFLTHNLAGTYTFSKNESPHSIALQVQNSMLEASKSKGHRRNRVIEMGLSNQSVSSSLHSIYLKLLKKN